MSPTKEEYDEIHSQDANVEGKPHGWIQWKGTDVCIDLYCACGYHGHFDGAFFYHYKCPACGAYYAVGSNIVLIPLNKKQVERIKREYAPMEAFKTVDLHD